MDFEATADTVIVTEEGAVPVISAEAPLEAAHGVADAAHAAESAGFPQLDPSTYASQVFWLAVAFCLLYWLMARVALPRIAEVLDMRQRQRDGNLGRAEELRDETQKVRDAYEKALARAHEDAQARMAEADADVAELVARETSAFGENARKRVAAAEQAIAKARAEALAALPDVAADIAAEIAAKVAGAQVSKADAKLAVTAVMKQKEAA